MLFDLVVEPIVDVHRVEELTSRDSEGALEALQPSERLPKKAPQATVIEWSNGRPNRLGSSYA